jgi:hypothetical protein
VCGMQFLQAAVHDRQKTNARVPPEDPRDRA